MEIRTCVPCTFSKMVLKASDIPEPLWFQKICLPFKDKWQKELRMCSLRKKTERDPESFFTRIPVADQWFSSLSTDSPGSFIQTQIAEPHSEFLTQQVRGGAWELWLLTSSQVTLLLLVWGPHFGTSEIPRCPSRIPLTPTACDAESTFPSLFDHQATTLPHFSTEHLLTLIGG